VKKVLFGGQTVTRQFVEALANMVPRVGTGLGLSEMAGFVTYTGITTNVDDVVSNVGWWMPVTPLTIRKPMNPDGTAGEELPAGETGEICFSGPQVFIEYVNNPEAYAKTVTKEGICYTGDLGHISDQGLIFCGRAKLVIKPKGYQVFPGQIEDHFASLKEKVAACGAVGAPHDLFSEGIVLFVEVKKDARLTRDDLEAHARGIAAYMRPSHYVLLEPATFPLNRVAKPDYVKLGELARAEVEKLRAAGGWDRE
jgi:acyl-CoA synthetase (AMP-forming)/AMP-acid ligase II